MEIKKKIKNLEEKKVKNYLVSIFNRPIGKSLYFLLEHHLTNSIFFRRYFGGLTQIIEGPTPIL